MCLIALCPPGKKLEDWEIRSAFNKNSDGFGIMMPHPEKEGLRIHRILSKTSDAVVELYHQALTNPKLASHPHGIHFRFKTHGKVDLANTHPFRVLRKDKHGMDLFMMHNGVISAMSGIKTDDDKSDTWKYIRHLIRPLLKENPALIYNPKFQIMMGMSIGSPNKLLFMDGDGKTIIVNGYQGKTREDGIWLSNDYSIYSSPVMNYGRGASEYNRHWMERFGSRRYSNTTTTTTTTKSKSEATETKVPFDPSNSVLLGTSGGRSVVTANNLPDPSDNKFYDSAGKFMIDAWKKECESFFPAFVEEVLRSRSGEQQNATTDTSDGSTNGASTVPQDQSQGSEAAASSTAEVQPDSGSHPAVTCKESPGTDIVDCEKSCDCLSIIEKSKSQSVFAKGGTSREDSPFLNTTGTTKGVSVTTQDLMTMDEDELLETVSAYPDLIRDWIMDQLLFLDDITSREYGGGIRRGKYYSH